MMILQNISSTNKLSLLWMQSTICHSSLLLLLFVTIWPWPIQLGVTNSSKTLARVSNIAFN
jgi:hypothetical protein